MRTTNFATLFLVVSLLFLTSVSEAVTYYDHKNPGVNVSIMLRMTMESDVLPEVYFTPVERSAFTSIVEAVMYKNKRVVDRWRSDKKKGYGPLVIVGGNSRLSMLTNTMLALRFSNKVVTQKLCSGDLYPPACELALLDRSNWMTRRRWWNIAALFVKEFACKY